MSRSHRRPGYQTGELYRSGPHSLDTGHTCAACGEPILAGDYNTTILLGPGANAETRADYRRGITTYCVYVHLHWACATGEEE